MKIVPENIKNILILRNDRFGEFLLNIPAFRALRQTFINAKIIIVVDPSVKELAENIPYLDEVIVWGGDIHTMKEKFGLFMRLVKKRVDLAVMLNPSREFNILSWLLGIPVRAGYNRKCGFLLTHKIEDKKYLGERHEREYNLELAAAIGAKTREKELFLEVSDLLLEKVSDAYNLKGDGRLIALHPWTSDTVKEWGVENFRFLAERLIKELALTVVLVGGEKERESSRSAFPGFDKNFINLTGKTSLLESAAVLKRCILLVSCDSGPVHLASCVNTPVLALFRNDLPGKTAKRWGPLSSGSEVIEKSPLASLTADEVFLRIRRMLKR
ncbi:MAG TPA: glycosyltransferase family 9 protein [Candidatus Margulisiibacteriota bacterium]|nr:glycosyltransferase family 9 protein [Candidatus Margulisiibacteriota bacterium]